MFKVGDYVRLKGGWTKMFVTHTQQANTGLIVYARYCGVPENQAIAELDYDYKRYDSDFMYWNTDDSRCKNDHTKPGHEHTLYQKPQACSEDNTMPVDPKLYQTNEKKPRYGTFLTTNTQGQYVLEMRGEDGKVEAFDLNKLTKVIPYTFSAKSPVHNHREVHYIGTKGEVKVGDVLVSQSGNTYYVTAIDTAYECPRKVFVGSKLTSKPFGR